MINTRLDFQRILETVLGSRNVYFQPAENVSLKYPCITYKLLDVPEKYADNEKYIRNYKYKVTLIHQDPDNDIVNKILNLKQAKFENHFSTQGLNHYVFNIYYKNEKEIK